MSKLARIAIVVVLILLIVAAGAVIWLLSPAAPLPDTISNLSQLPSGPATLPW